MQANDEFLLNFLDGRGKYFTVPLYQRNYDWRKEHCETLFNDILKIVDSQKVYFLGSIVILYEYSREGLIIDGQQRLTSISLLLLAIANLIINEENLYEDKMLSEEIIETYLVNKYAKNEKRMRLKPTKEDNEAFLRLFQNKNEDFIVNSNITVNYNYFYSAIKLEIKKGLSLNQLLEAMRQLKIVQVDLKANEDNPQEIFESLNSTGKQLEDSDLVRNFILMGQPLKEQEHFYSNYWAKIEKNTLNETSEFIRHYLTHKHGSVPNQNKIYVTFKDFVKKNYSSIHSLKNLLKELLLFSKFYYIIVNVASHDEKLNKVLKSIKRLKITVCYPFLFELFYRESKQTITQAELVEALEIIEALSVRRAICNVPTNALNKIYATLSREIERQKDYENQYFEIFKYILISSSNIPSKRFPNDKEFLFSFQNEELYYKKQYIAYILSKLEKYDNKENFSVEKALNEGVLTIEHVMPQELSAEWKMNLGSRFDEIHHKYLHTIGNLTLTGYNSEYSNKVFLEKRKMPNGFDESTLKLNKFISQQTKWTDEEIVLRAQKLSNIALEVWKFPTTTYDISNVIDEYIYFSDDFDFTNTKPKKIYFLNSEYITLSWSKVYKQVIDVLYDVDSKIIFNLVDDNYLHRISFSQTNLRKPYSKDGKVFFELNLSTKNIITTLKKLLDSYKLTGDDLGILLKK